MADVKISDLVELSALEDDDFIEVSEDDGVGGYTSKKIKGSSLRSYMGVSNWGALASPPASTTDGDTYYDTTIKEHMFYDSSRSKWLSITSFIIMGERNGTCNAGVYYRIGDGIAYSSTRGFNASKAGTVVELHVSRTDTDAATFEMLADGVQIAEIASAAQTGEDDTVNGNYAANEVLAFRNKAGSNTVSDGVIWALVRHRRDVI